MYGKSLSICMTARDNNDEGAFVKQPSVLNSIKFQNVYLYEYVHVGAVHKSFQYSMKGHTSEFAQSQFQPYYKFRSRFLRFRKFRLVILSTRV